VMDTCIFACAPCLLILQFEAFKTIPISLCPQKSSTGRVPLAAAAAAGAAEDASPPVALVLVLAPRLAAAAFLGAALAAAVAALALGAGLVRVVSLAGALAAPSLLVAVFAARWRDARGCTAASVPECLRLGAMATFRRCVSKQKAGGDLASDLEGAATGGLQSQVRRWDYAL